MAGSSLHLPCVVFGDSELGTVNKDLQFFQVRSILGPDEGLGDEQRATVSQLPCLTPCCSLPSWS